MSTTTLTPGAAPASDAALAARRRLFLMSCIALTVTAMTFAIRAGILTELSEEFGLSDTRLGVINSMAFLGFPVAMIVGGLIYNQVGPRLMMIVAFVGHVAGLVLTITAGGFWGLLISTFCIGFANGAVEAACNPMVSDAYPDKRVAMLNRFHVWFPGGIVIGALVAKFMGDAGLGWQAQIAVMLIPTAIYGFMVFTQDYATVKPTGVSTLGNVRSLLTPLFFVILFAMTLTATSELGTQQWVERILGNAGADPLLILAMVTGLMAVGRFFAGPVIHALNPIGVLLASAVIATLGIFLMSQATGGTVYLAAIVFAVGVMYFWPTMIGFVGEYLPKTGALGMSLVGGAGMFGVSLWNPVIGGWIDGARAEAVAAGLTGDAAELAAGQSALSNLALFPAALIVVFGALFALRSRFEPQEPGIEAPIGTPAEAR